MATAGTILSALFVSEIVVIAQMCTVRIPALSISFASVAPQRVQVPQLDVIRTACTPFCANSLAIASPNFLAFSTEVPLPTVA